LSNFRKKGREKGKKGQGERPKITKKNEGGKGAIFHELKMGRLTLKEGLKEGEGGGFF